MEKEEKKIKGIKKSDAEKIEGALQMYKGLLKTKQKLTNFKEPLAFLIRRNGEIDFYEKATKGELEFVHSSGDERRIELIPSKLLDFPYADRRVKLYILHEDFPIPIPDSDPVVSSESISISQGKSLHDVDKFKRKAEQYKNASVYKILIAIAIIIFVGAVASTLVPWERIFNAGAKNPQSLGLIIPMIRRWKYIQN
ncbi:hypothetical protein GF336_00210 [Candidatus Woesearchaeota archaeon]|nr:hypothetical protein [Candidatus Woesearchaeota archaeon]